MFFLIFPLGVVQAIEFMQILSLKFRGRVLSSVLLHATKLLGDKYINQGLPETLPGRVSCSLVLFDKNLDTLDSCNTALAY
jgi:hypothetical protein